MHTSYALTSYAQTGKDTIVRDLQQQKLKLIPYSYELSESKECKWVVYCGPTADITDLLHLFDVNNSSFIERYALADALKLETHKYLKLHDCPAHAFENVKNTLLVPHPTIPYIIKTIRGWYIDYGQEARKTDPLCWVKQVNHLIEQEKFAIDEKTPLIDIITDFRFENELMDRIYPNGTAQTAPFITTIRLHRKDVPVAVPFPDRSIDSEHNLDDFKTKYLFIPTGSEEYKVALKRFPQYNDFQARFLVYHQDNYQEMTSTKISMKRKIQETSDEKDDDVATNKRHKLTTGQLQD